MPQRVFTCCIPEMNVLFRLQHLRKPGFSEANVISVTAGWTTVHLPNWHGTTQQFDRIVHDPNRYIKAPSGAGDKT